MFKNFFKRTASKFYPFIPNELDLRARLPRYKLEELRVLNVGAGSGHSALARQLPYLSVGQLDFIDVHQPYLDTAQTREYDAFRGAFILADVRTFDTSDYDVVLMFDILEHLPKADSLAVMDKIQCKQIIFIPLEKEFRPNTFGAKSQDHLSLWTEQDFKSRGYKTEVLKNFHNEGGRIFDALWAIKN